MTSRTVALLGLCLTFGACDRTPPDDTGDTDTDTSDTDTNDTDTDTDTDTGTDTDTNGVATDCHTLPADLPDWAGNIDPQLVTGNAYDFTASGLADAVTAADASDVDGTELTGDDTITITGAIVHNVGYQPQALEDDEHVNFYLADQDDTIYVRLEQGVDPVVLEPGDEISMTVTKVTNYFGDLQISAYEAGSFSVTNTDQDVYVKDSTGATLATDDWFWTHHVYGELTSAPSGCGGSSVCFDFTHGGAAGTVTTLRIQNDNLQIPLEQGDCVELYAPLDQHESDGQFDITDFGWHRWYGNSGG